MLIWMTIRPRIRTISLAVVILAQATPVRSSAVICSVGLQPVLHPVIARDDG
jgi:hypothetical protein